MGCCPGEGADGVTEPATGSGEDDELGVGGLGLGYESLDGGVEGFPGVLGPIFEAFGGGFGVGGGVVAAGDDDCLVGVLVEGVEGLLGEGDGVGAEGLGNGGGCMVCDGGGRCGPVECFGGHDARVGRRH